MATTTWLLRREGPPHASSLSRWVLGLTPLPILMEKTELIQKAKPAEQVESYNPMVTCMKFVTEQGAELSHLLSVACKNMVGDHRSSWRVIKSMEPNTDTADKKLQQTGRKRSRN